MIIKLTIMILIKKIQLKKIILIGEWFEVYWRFALFWREKKIGNQTNSTINEKYKFDYVNHNNNESFFKMVS